ncbi:MAG TPA: glucose-1-phosphate adenylyltransferase [Candidatus Glassbacteria bacterium]|nr:glucose-1-phosphate adenylyltransferase [Candidatus Glassbacteria bacterium]
MYTRDTLAVILGGGRGTRLAPLTLARCKPAINLAGKFRLIDIPVSNCINSQVRKIFVVTQFLSAGLHRHIFQTYRFDRFTDGFVEILAAEQTPTNMTWFQGTADAIRQSLRYIVEWNIKYVLILSGDQLYSMDYGEMLEYHVNSAADVTVSTLPVPQSEVYRMGIMQIDEAGRIVNFVEKPSDPKVQEELATEEIFLRRFNVDPRGRHHLGSMGIYIFDRDVLVELLADGRYTDFGREVIPAAVKSHKVCAYVFDGFWEDVGTIESYYRVNLSLTDPMPPFNFYDENWPIFTHPRSLPGVKLVGGTTEQAILCEGSIIDRAHIQRAIIGVRSVIRSGTRVKDSLLLGADYYDTPGEVEGFRRERSSVPIGIGRECEIEGAIIDKNVRIGDRVKIRPRYGQPDQEGDGYYVRGGIVIVPRGAVIEAGKEI